MVTLALPDITLDDSRRGLALLSSLVPVFNFDKLHFRDKRRRSLPKSTRWAPVFTAVTPAALTGSVPFCTQWFWTVAAAHFVFGILVGEI